MLEPASPETEAQLNDIAEDVAQGSYQLEYLRRHHSASGADLDGKAGRYAQSYTKSRESVHERLENRGFVLATIYDYDDHGRKLVVVAQSGDELASYLQDINYRMM